MALNRRIKDALDPDGILNPGAIHDWRRGKASRRTRRTTDGYGMQGITHVDEYGKRWKTCPAGGQFAMDQLEKSSRRRRTTAAVTALGVMMFASLAVLLLASPATASVTIDPPASPRAGTVDLTGTVAA